MTNSHARSPNASAIETDMSRLGEHQPDDQQPHRQPVGLEPVRAPRRHEPRVQDGEGAGSTSRRRSGGRRARPGGARARRSRRRRRGRRAARAARRRALHPARVELGVIHARHPAAACRIVSHARRCARRRRSARRTRCSPRNPCSSRIRCSRRTPRSRHSRGRRRLRPSPRRRCSARPLRCRRPPRSRRRRRCRSRPQRSGHAGRSHHCGRSHHSGRADDARGVGYTPAEPTMADASATAAERHTNGPSDAAVPPARSRTRRSRHVHDDPNALRSSREPCDRAPPRRIWRRAQRGRSDFAAPRARFLPYGGHYMVRHCPHSQRSTLERRRAAREPGARGRRGPGARRGGVAALGVASRPELCPRAGARRSWDPVDGVRGDRAVGDPAPG